MIRKVFFIIAIFGIIFAKEPDVISRDEAITIALEALKMSPDKLSLKSDIDVDSFRLSVVDLCMERPTELPEIIDSLADELEFTTGASFFSAIAGFLDIKPATPPLYGKQSKNPWANEKNVPPKIRKALDILMEAFYDANVSLESAFEELDSFQLDTLFSRAPEYLTPGAEKLADEVDESTLEEMDKQELLEEKQDERFFTLASRVNQQKLLESATRIAQSTWKAKDLSTAVKSREGNGIAPDTIAFGDIIYYAETEFGPVIIGGAGPTVYLSPCAIIIDLGGDDEYRCAAGGTANSLKFAVAIDLDGNDVYWSESSFAHGAALGGVGILLDLKGNDHYRSLHHSQGTGILGWGILWDYDGDDVYVGHTAVQGVGFLGGGLLYDATGNDRYEAHLYSQAFGFVGGLGMIYELEGNDSYICTGASVDKLRYADHHVTLSQGFGYGYRPDWSGGIGFLMEHSGNDVYTSDIFGQAASYWFALGTIYDIHGNDNYISYQYAQGSGVHLAAAALIDLQGNDAYVAHGVSQGCGHDLAIGFLNDRSGDDNYVTWDLAQGAGNANGIGILVDEKVSEDAYVAKREYNVQGYGNWRRSFGSVGLMLDLGGDDAYAGKGEQGKWWSWSNYGLGIDFPAGADNLTESQK
ncbi:hypothetical protein DRQ33_01775 [bacterium]|nr:MAG: hypothetical protein DRQ33_01775 [bacterium]